MNKKHDLVWNLGMREKDFTAITDDGDSEDSINQIFRSSPTRPVERNLRNRKVVDDDGSLTGNFSPESSLTLEDGEKSYAADSVNSSVTFDSFAEQKRLAKENMERNRKSSNGGAKFKPSENNIMYPDDFRNVKFSQDLEFIGPLPNTSTSNVGVKPSTKASSMNTADDGDSKDDYDRFIALFQEETNKDCVVDGSKSNENPKDQAPQSKKSRRKNNNTQAAAPRQIESVDKNDDQNVLPIRGEYRKLLLLMNDPFIREAVLSAPPHATAKTLVSHLKRSMTSITAMSKTFASSAGASKEVSRPSTSGPPHLPSNLNTEWINKQSVPIIAKFEPKPKTPRLSTDCVPLPTFDTIDKLQSLNGRVILLDATASASTSYHNVKRNATHNNGYDPIDSGKGGSLIMLEVQASSATIWNEAKSRKASKYPTGRGEFYKAARADSSMSELLEIERAYSSQRLSSLRMTRSLDVLSTFPENGYAQFKRKYGVGFTCLVFDFHMQLVGTFQADHLAGVDSSLKSETLPGLRMDLPDHFAPPAKAVPRTRPTITRKLSSLTAKDKINYILNNYSNNAGMTDASTTAGGQVGEAAVGEDSSHSLRTLDEQAIGSSGQRANGNPSLRDLHAHGSRHVLWSQDEDSMNEPQRLVENAAGPDNLVVGVGSGSVPVSSGPKKYLRRSSSDLGESEFRNEESLGLMSLDLSAIPANVFAIVPVLLDESILATLPPETDAEYDMAREFFRDSDFHFKLSTSTGTEGSPSLAQRHFGEGEEADSDGFLDRVHMARRLYAPPIPDDSNLNVAQVCLYVRSYCESNTISLA